MIDKSYANKRTGSLSKLADIFTLIVPSAFYYEVFTTAPENRVKELNSFPNFRRIHIPSVQRLELETGKAAASFEARELSVNPEVVSKSWRLRFEDEAVIQKYKTASLDPVLDFWRNVLTAKAVPGFSARELAATGGSEDDFVCLCELVRQEQRVQRIVKEIEWIHAEKLDARWIHYRLFQTWALQGLILLRRYRNSGDVISEERLEHDVHDIEYLMLGLHAGALATAETSTKLPKASMSWRFRILEPAGLLITS